MTSGIYALKWKNAYYVGSSKDIESRVLLHFRHLEHKKHKNKKLQTLWDSTNIKDWTFVILQRVSSGSLTPYEQSWVSFLEASSNNLILNINKHISKHPKTIPHQHRTLFLSPDELLLETALKEI